MLKINLLPHTNAAPLPFLNPGIAQHNPLQHASQFAMANASQQHLIYRPGMLGAAAPVIAQAASPFVESSMPFAGILDFASDHLYISVPAYFGTFYLLFFLLRRIPAVRNWLDKPYVPSMEDIEGAPETDESDGDPKFAPGSRDIPKGTPIDE